ncbi:hypothetical protein [Dokdonella sp.]
MSTPRTSIRQHEIMRRSDAGNPSAWRLQIPDNHVSARGVATS